MGRIPKFILIAVLLPLLASCGVFFTPMEGRWNPADPENELLTFNPSLDGYVDGGGWNDGSTYLLATYYSSKIILMKFDAGALPETVAASCLRLTVDGSASGDVNLYVYRIIQSWDSGTVDYTTASSPGIFYDDSKTVVAIVPYSYGTGDEVNIPLTGIFSGERDLLQNGVVILSDPEERHFGSTGLGTAPLLLVEPE
jgi:hypothetical protein